MSKIIGIIVVFITILYVSRLRATEIQERTFFSGNYNRICAQGAEQNYGSPTSICERVAKQSDMNRGVYKLYWWKPWTWCKAIHGECKDVAVKLTGDHYGAALPVKRTVRIVFCKLGHNYYACASASTEPKVIEYFRYEEGSREAEFRCTRQNSLTLP